MGTAKGGDSNIGRRRVAARRDPSERYQENRAELVRAAAGAFRKRGFTSTTIQDISDELGINRATLYYYFSNKEELFQEVVQTAVRTNVVEVERIRDSDLCPADKLHAVVVSLMQSYADNYPYLFVWLQEDMARVFSRPKGKQRELAQQSRRYQRAVEAIVAEGMESGAFSAPASPSIVAFGVIGMVNWTHRWFKPGRASAREVAEAYAHMVLKGLEPR